MSNGELEGSGQIETTAQPSPAEQPTTFNPSTPINLFKCLKERTCPGFDFPEGQQFFPSTPKPRYFPTIETESADLPVGSSVDGMRTTYIAMIAGGFLLGCLVGIITTVLIYSKRSRSRPRLRASRRSNRNKAQMNPREQTFEPLDLSLNQSRVSQMQTPDTPRRVVEENRGHVVATSQSHERNVITQLSCHSPSYLNFEPPTPPSMTGSNESDEAEQGNVGRRVTLPQVKCISFRNFNVSSIRIGRESNARQAKVILFFCCNNTLNFSTIKP